MIRRSRPLVLGALALLCSLLFAPLAAHADGESNEVGTCLSSDQVWLLVITDTDEVLANECVGTPANGEDALKAAGLTLGLDANQFLCTIGGYPAECPTTFTGAFWNYYQGKPGEAYAFSQVGAAESTPQPGSIEAWCYSTAEEQTCTPPTLKIVENGTEVPPAAGLQAVDLPVTGQAQASASASPSASASEPAQETAPEGGAPWAWIVGGVVVVGIAVALILWQRSRSTKGGQLGGR